MPDLINVSQIPAEDRPLSVQQLRFVEEYCVDPTSITQAAKRAGYALGSASQAASRLMADPRIKRAIQVAQDKRAESIGISKERILQEIAKIAFAEVGSEITVEDDEIDLSKLRGSASEVIVSTSASGGRKSRSVSVRTVKQADKLGALYKLGQHVGMFKEQTVDVNLSLDNLIKDSYVDEKDTQIFTEEDEKLFLPAPAAI